LRRAEVELMAAQWAVHERRSPLPFHEKARVAIERAFQLNPENAGAYYIQAALYQSEAEWLMEKEQKPEKEIKKGLLMTEKALSLNAGLSEAIATRGVLY